MSVVTIVSQMQLIEFNWIHKYPI